MAKPAANTTVPLPATPEDCAALARRYGAQPNTTNVLVVDEYVPLEYVPLKDFCKVVVVLQNKLATATTSLTRGRAVRAEVLQALTSEDN